MNTNPPSAFYVVKLTELVQQKLLTPLASEWVAAATSCGALIGGLIGGNMVDTYGRKWILAFGDVFFVIGGECSSDP